jgi:hypothetical protein
MFVQKGIGILSTGEVATLSIERVSDPSAPLLFVTVFEIPLEEVPLFYKREDEYEIETTKYYDVHGNEQGEGLVCMPSTDEKCRKRWGDAMFASRYESVGLFSVWSWDPLKIFPAPVYLRHCVLAAKSNGAEVGDNFLDSTFLGDRVTTIRSYLEKRSYVMSSVPPPDLVHRYNG